MPYEGDVKMPCGRKYYCGSRTCRHASLYAGLREGVQYRRGPYDEAADAPAAPPPKKPLAAPADIVYLYDGSLPGFFCCVHESVYTRQIPSEIWPEQEAQPSLFEQRMIATDPDKAARVAASVPEKISERAMDMIQTVFLSCLEQKELAMLRFLLLGYQLGSGVPYMFGHEDVKPVLEAEKHLGGEAHLLKGFVRFSDYDGVLAATITPKNFVLPFLAEHFVMRYSEENFIIFDKTHKAALLYENGQHRIVPMEGITFPEADETEENYRALWKQFYNTIAIEARTNWKCRRTHMPKRYWENMLEVAHLL